MEIETFEVTELADRGIIENAEETKSLVEKLGLNGQKKFVSEKGGVVFSYRKMTRQERNVYGTICPTASKIKEYTDGIIPLRVLQVASYVMETGFIDELVVWSPISSDIKDPLLIGEKKVKNSWGGTDTEYYILARWGEVLESFENLIKTAKEITLVRLKTEYNKAKCAIAADEISMDNVVSEFILGISDKPRIYYSGLH